jgi:biotin carboxyl carrier protein
LDVLADIPGTVATLHVADGAQVDKGEPVAEIECMKTFFPIVAPAAGIVRLHVRLGEMVGQDQLIASIEVSK